VDFGQVSARNVVTSGDGRATVVYTAPSPPADSVDEGLVIQILATPTGSDYANATTRAVSIRLVPPGVILPPNGTPKPRFIVVPSSPVSRSDVTFDATSSTDDGQIVSYAWNFGDATTGSGQIAHHQFEKGGSYTVTLTVTDDRGLSASTTASVFVIESANPQASFVFSPSSPLPNEDVMFNASASRADTGRSIVSYEWEFGTGGSDGTGTGVTITRRFSPVATYVVTLTVTDDVGNKGTTSKSLTVRTPALLASFVFSPLSPSPRQNVVFDASGSSTEPGHSIEAYDWNFGDNGTGSGRTANHSFSRDGTYSVTLTIRDDSGTSATTSNEVTVSSGDLEAAFTYSPTDPSGTDVVHFNGSDSSSLFGIRTYTWNFGDGSASGSGKTVDHVFRGCVAGGTTSVTFVVRLTVVDGMSRTATVTKDVLVKSCKP
jgi:PKD repeat protein